MPSATKHVRKSFRFRVEVIQPEEMEEHDATVARVPLTSPPQLLRTVEEEEEGAASKRCSDGQCSISSCSRSAGVSTSNVGRRISQLSSSARAG